MVLIRRKKSEILPKNLNSWNLMKNSLFLLTRHRNVFTWKIAYFFLIKCLVISYRFKNSWVCRLIPTQNLSYWMKSAKESQRWKFGKCAQRRVNETAFSFPQLIRGISSLLVFFQLCTICSFKKSSREKSHRWLYGSAILFSFSISKIQSKETLCKFTVQAVHWQGLLKKRFCEQLSLLTNMGAHLRPI